MSFAKGELYHSVVGLSIKIRISHATIRPTFLLLFEKKRKGGKNLLLIQQKVKKAKSNIILISEGDSMRRKNFRPRQRGPPTQRKDGCIESDVLQV